MATKTYRPLNAATVKTLASIAHMCRKDIRCWAGQQNFNLVHMNRLTRRGLINLHVVGDAYTNNCVSMTPDGQAVLDAR